MKLKEIRSSDLPGHFTLAHGHSGQLWFWVGVGRKRPSTNALAGIELTAVAVPV